MKNVGKIIAGVAPCPFCGHSDGVSVSEEPIGLSFVNPGYRIQAQCVYCGASSPTITTGFTSADVEIQLAVEQWNRRV